MIKGIQNIENWLQDTMEKQDNRTPNQKEFPGVFDELDFEEELEEEKEEE